MTRRAAAQRDGGAQAGKSAQRALDVLTLLAKRVRPLPAMTIARELGIPKSSTHHLLNVMKERGFVTYYDAEHAWGLGVLVFEVGSAYLRSAPLQRLGRPLLEALTDETGAAAHLAILNATDALYIDKEEAGGSAPQLVTQVGVRLPAHLTAVGRAILGGLSDAQVAALYANQRLSQRTGRGPTSVEQLLEQLQEVRRRGYAVDDQMVTPGIKCIAAPVVSHEQIAIAAVGVTFVAAQHDDASVAGITDRVSAAAARLSKALGGSPRSSNPSRAA